MQVSPTHPSLLRLLAAIFYDLMIVLFGLFMLVGFTVLPIYQWATGHDNIDAGNYFFSLFLLLTAFLYYGLSWRIGGQTIGMKAWRLVLVSDDEARGLSWMQALIRFLTAFVSAAFGMMGYLYALIQKDRRTLHDLASNTHILYFPKRSKTSKNPPK